ncbi:hypothetical protein F4779DRAFT_572552 [Xylariaceae sp. FL0662B]|nr:hypothetical protein F4779DRAFT_572552 [Xylariaceae sp. FL0662B]
MAYHRLNFALEGVVGRLQLHEGNSEGQEQHVQDQSDDEPALIRLGIIEQQPWYQSFTENSEAATCIWSCFQWCKDQLAFRPPRSAELSACDKLGAIGAAADDDGDESNTFRQDVFLFTYLFDLWVTSQKTSASPYENRWAQLSERALGIPPTITLHTMSSLILTRAAGATVGSPPSPLQRRATRSSSSRNDGALLDFAQGGIDAIEAFYEKRRLVAEFIGEFVFIHDLYGEDDGEEEREARSAAEEYVDRKLALEQLFGDGAGMDWAAFPALDTDDGSVEG